MSVKFSVKDLEDELHHGMPEGAAQADAEAVLEWGQRHFSSIFLLELGTKRLVEMTHWNGFADWRN
jgi:hypothetical protein